MRIWDINPGYLNDKSLLGEHRELHGIVSILVNDKKGYAKHPETLRWKGCNGALAQRHAMLQAEMSLRGFREQSPVTIVGEVDRWPSRYIDPPAAQFALLAKKYRNKRPGRIPLPVSTQELWAQHKYSVLARDPERYKALGQSLAAAKKLEMCDDVALELVEILRCPPSSGRLANALQHMWGHVSRHVEDASGYVNDMKPKNILSTMQRTSLICGCNYLIHSTALGELSVWLAEAEH
jgi:hypothetical protein